MYSQIIRIALLHIVYHPQAVINNGKQWRRLVCYFSYEISMAEEQEFLK